MARLARFVGAELGLAALILLVTSGLSVTPPARHESPYWPLSHRLAYDAMIDAPGAKARLLVGSQIAVLGLVAGAAALVMRQHAALLLAGSVAAVVAGVWVALPPLVVDAYPTTYLRPGIPYQASSIVKGIDLYAAHCATCHGRGGEGDGPGGAGLVPRPADLTAPHTGQHTAGDLFWWLTHGIPSSGMPPFADVLTEDDRWDVINFLRALAAGAEARVLAPLVEPGRTWLVAPDFAFGVGPSPARSAEGAARPARGAARAVHAARTPRGACASSPPAYGELQVLGTEIIAVPHERGPRHPRAARRRPTDPVPGRHGRRRGHRAHLRAVRAHARPPPASGRSRRRTRTWSS